MKRSPTILAPLILQLFLTACAAPSSSDPEPEALQTLHAPAPAQFKVLTYNTWHGLHVGPYWVRLQESPETRQARFDLQVRQMAEEAPDIILLQEVNPLPRKARDYVRALAELGLEYTEVHQVDGCGLRISKRMALIPDLNNGLAILAKRELRQKRIKGLKILGGFGMCRSGRGFQLHELRYALISEITWPGNTTRYLVATVHKHSGFEASARFLEKLSDSESETKAAAHSQIAKEFKRSVAKRKAGLRILMQALEGLKQKEGYEAVLIGGDFNFVPGSREYEKALRLGLVDTHEVAHRAGELYTHDPVRNDLILDGDEPIVPNVVRTAIAKESPEDQLAIVAAYQEDMQLPKRIDYIFVDSFLPEACLRQVLFGLDKGSDGLPASDHYGVLNTWSLTSSTC